MVRDPWFHYYFQAITDLTRTLRPLIMGTCHPEHTTQPIEEPMWPMTSFV